LKTKGIFSAYVILYFFRKKKLIDLQTLLNYFL
jgi:hypothetical protein